MDTARALATRSEHRQSRVIEESGTEKMDVRGSRPGVRCAAYRGQCRPRSALLELFFFSHDFTVDSERAGHEGFQTGPSGVGV